jgi:hypothetical protein
MAKHDEFSYEIWMDDDGEVTFTFRTFNMNMARNIACDLLQYAYDKFTVMQRKNAREACIQKEEK